MALSPLRQFIVGIDPGVHTGVAILRRKDDKLLSWSTHNFFTVQEYLVNVFPDKSQVKIFVEHPFGGHVKTKKQKELLNEGATDVYAGNAGGNRREAQLLAEAIKRLGFDDVELVNPVKEKKWDQHRFQLFAKTRLTASEHERDATRLAVYYANKRQEKK